MKLSLDQNYFSYFRNLHLYAALDKNLTIAKTSELLNNLTYTLFSCPCEFERHMQEWGSMAKEYKLRLSCGI